VFDLSLPKLLILAVLALVVFGPEELPKIAAQAGRALRELRRIADGARADLREGLGPEFSDFGIDDLNPRRFVQKRLLSDLNRDDSAGTGVSGRATTARLRDRSRVHQARGHPKRWQLLWLLAGPGILAMLGGCACASALWRSG
jgi:sec-independent protein translocase protein TatB